jgi:hypothetical protein
MPILPPCCEMAPSVDPQEYTQYTITLEWKKRGGKCRCCAATRRHDASPRVPVSQTFCCFVVLVPSWDATETIYCIVVVVVVAIIVVIVHLFQLEALVWNSKVLTTPTCPLSVGEFVVAALTAASAASAAPMMRMVVVRQFVLAPDEFHASRRHCRIIIILFVLASPLVIRRQRMHPTAAAAASRCCVVVIPFQPPNAVRCRRLQSHQGHHQQPEDGAQPHREPERQQQPEKRKNQQCHGDGWCVSVVVVALLLVADVCFFGRLQFRGIDRK